MVSCTPKNNIPRSNIDLILLAIPSFVSKLSKEVLAEVNGLDDKEIKEIFK